MRPAGKDSITSPIVACNAVKTGDIPKAAICIQAELIVAIVAITARISLVDALEKNPVGAVKTSDNVKVYAAIGVVEVVGE
jgi:predicted aconitase with swiveling domain